jgi:flagellar FliJ protein
MKAFSFSLEQVMRWRMTTLKTEKVRLEGIRFHLEQARIERLKLSQSLSDAKQSIGSQGLLTGADLRNIDAYTGRLGKQVELAGQKMSSLSEAIAKQLLVVSGADRNVRLLERLRERRLAEWQTEVNKESEEQSSDFSAGQWQRGKSDTGRYR